MDQQAKRQIDEIFESIDIQALRDRARSISDENDTIECLKDLTRLGRQMELIAKTLVCGTLVSHLQKDLDEFETEEFERAADGKKAGDC